MKEFDLVIFGATGLTGGQTAAYVNRLAKDEGISWAIAGRNKSKLEELVANLSLEPDGIVVADAFDETSVQAMVASTRALINLAGPYAVYAPSVVAACAKLGVAYADLSGEVLYVRDMIDLYGDTAKKSGARIIPICGYEALPFDLGALLVAQRFKDEFGSEPDQVNAIAKFQFDGKIIYPSDGVSGGTWNSGVEMLKGDNVEGVNDPHLLIDGERSWLPAGSAQYNLLKNALPSGNGWLAPMIPSPWLNPPVVYRTQEILREESGASGFTYREGMDTSGYFPGDKLFKPFAALGMAIAMESGERLMSMENSTPRKLMGKLMQAVGPKPGDGPKPERLDLWSYTIHFIASDEEGNTAKATVTGKGQPGYKSTADIIGQVGIILAKDDDRLPERAGILTPASALGLDLVGEFAKARLHFT